MDQLIEQISLLSTISDELALTIRETFSTEQHKKGSLLLEQGHYCRKLYFLNKGIVRSFHYDKGKDISSWFYKENDFVTSWHSIINHQPSFDNLEVLQDCTTLHSISIERYNDLMDQFPAFQKFGRKLAEIQLAFLDYYSRGYGFLSAKERYDLLINHFPDIELYVKLGHIASYLGISQETLSRIRS